MKIMKRLVRSFKLLKRRRKPPTPSPAQAHKNINEFIVDPEIKKVMHDLVDAAKNMSYATMPIDEHKIDLDCSALLLTCFSFGYTPSQIFDLLAKTYGSIMACAPESRIVDGQKVTRDMLQTMFFSQCIGEKEKLTKMANNMDEGFVRRGTLH